jgi:iron complex outermembrane recepter protein
MKRLMTCILIAASGDALAQPVADEIVVFGDMREATLDALPGSVTVLDDESIARRDAQHLEEVLTLAANVNVASGASRARFFQIRGIGERGQFAEPLNPSVGLLLDGVDVSTAATAAALLDVDQIEVFRGPQGTRYGANALAGLINIKTHAPSPSFEAEAGIDVANYNATTLHGIVSGPVGKAVTGRLAAQYHRSDGFLENAYLGSPTNERDELTVRGKLRFSPAPHITVDGLLGLVDIDNGYDAFSLDNDRTTLSDEPGRDAQRTTLAGVELSLDGSERYAIDASLNFATSDSTYGYDEDWTYVGFDPFGYSSTDYYLRDRNTLTAETRLVSSENGRLFNGSTDWAVGAYLLDGEEDLTRIYTFLPTAFRNTFETQRQALFGQLDADVGAGTVTLGLRVERHSAHYVDTEGVTFSPSDNLVGWRIGADKPMGRALMGYVLLSRGYKAGGFNTDGTLDADLRQYDPETLTSLELGIKGAVLGDRLTGRLALFSMRRDNVQIASSVTRVRDDGSAEFIDFIGNAAKGTNRGIEGEMELEATARLRVIASLGLLDSEYSEFVNSAGEDLAGREQAHAPGYQYSVSATYTFNDRWRFDATLEGRDDFFFSDSHDFKSRPYSLLHAGLTHEHGPWRTRLWARNLLDEDTYVRGYFFGNDPRLGYEPRGYTQLGEPRRVGLSVTRSF